MCVDKSRAPFEYDGMVVNGIKQGCGLLKSQYSCTYRQFNRFVEYFGEFSEDLFDGMGRLETEDFVYLGEFKQGRISGVGFLYQKNELESYVGQWRSDQKNGFGI